MVAAIWAALCATSAVLLVRIYANTLGIPMAARMPIMVTTTINSTRVKPRCLRNDVVGILYLPAILCLASADTEFIGTRVNARLMLWIMRSRQVERLAEPAKA